MVAFFIIFFIMHGAVTHARRFICCICAIQLCMIYSHLIHLSTCVRVNTYKCVRVLFSHPFIWQLNYITWKVLGGFWAFYRIRFWLLSSYKSFRFLFSFFFCCWCCCCYLFDFVCIRYQKKHAMRRRARGAVPLSNLSRIFFCVTYIAISFRF